MAEYVFWQQIVSPHMACLARALADRGNRVTYVATQVLSQARLEQGWVAPPLPGVRVLLGVGEADASDHAQRFASDAIHLTEGVRRNGYIGAVIKTLQGRRARWGAIMESLDERAWGTRRLRRYDYARVFRSPCRRPQFLLAIGINTPRWVAARGYPRDRIFEFTYFLEGCRPAPNTWSPSRQLLTIGFVGNLIRRKRLDLVIAALDHLRLPDSRLVVIGGGPLRSCLERMARARLGESYAQWSGVLSLDDTRQQIASFDYLVLPSDHDGWGAVVSEALIAGVPAVCSDACGAAEAVSASGVGGVFRAGSADRLAATLGAALARGDHTSSRRRQTADWARSLTSDPGAAYLSEITQHVYEDGPRPSTPWHRSSDGQGGNAGLFDDEPLRACGEFGSAALREQPSWAP